MSKEKLGEIKIKFLKPIKMVFKYKLEIIIFSLYFIFLFLIKIRTPVLSETHNPEKFYKQSDHYWYIKMSEDIFSIFRNEIRAPFIYRPLAAFIARFLPFDTQTSFEIITFMSFFLTGIMIYFTLRIFFSKHLSFVGLIIFCSFEYVQTITYPFFTLHFYNIYLTEPLAFFFLMGCFYSIFKDNTKLYFLSLFLGI